MNKLCKTMKYEWQDTQILLQSVPSLTMVLFVISVVLMNLLANKEMLNFGWIALDCGFLLSWISFLSMDMLTKRFGAKASIKLSFIAIIINLGMSIILFAVSKIPGNWGEFYSTNDVNVNAALNSTFGGTWYVVLGSMTAFAVASIVNALINEGIGKLMKNSATFRVFAVRSYVSTAIGQFVDNMLFALIVSHTFFGWSMFQVFTCSLAGALMELLSEVIFSPLGYRAAARWDRDGVGSLYIKWSKANKKHKGVTV